MKERYDLIILGAGAAGNAVARKIEDIDTLVIEKREIIGEPPECAGLISKNCLDILGINEGNFIQNEIYGAHIHSPKGEEYHIGGDRLHAYAIDRGEFDRFLAEEGKRKGNEYSVGMKAERVFRENKRVVVETKGYKFEAKLIVGADGVDSITRRTFFGYEPEEVLFGIGAEVEDVDLDPKNVHIFFGKNLAPGFFAWIIPISRDGKKARMGLCVTSPPPSPPKRLLHNLLNYHTTRPFLESAIVSKIIAGRIPLGYIKKSADDNVMLIGDAAFQVKPISGGGIYPIAVSSGICADIIKKAFEKNDFSRNMLQEYHSMWSEKLKRELVLGMWFRKVYRRMKDDELEKFLSYLKREDVINTINRYGDMDHPSKLILPMCRKIPALLSFLPRFIFST